MTRRFVDAVDGTGARIRDTRKTTPLLRFLEKHAVEAGGGVPHRSGLDTGILVKDNHVRLAGSVRQATLRALAGADGLPVEVEVEGLEQVEEAIAAGAHMLLLDNFTPDEVREAVAVIKRARPDRGLGRRPAGERAGLCRSGPGLHRGRRADALRSGRGHLAGGRAGLSPAEALRRALEARSVPWPAPLWLLGTVGSTSDWLKELAREDASPWTAVRAERQTAGRGRGGHEWASPPGNVYLSVILRAAARRPAASRCSRCSSVSRSRRPRARGGWPRASSGRTTCWRARGSWAESWSRPRPTARARRRSWPASGVNLALSPETLDEPLRSSVTSVRAARP